MVLKKEFSSRSLGWFNPTNLGFNEHSCKLHSSRLTFYMTGKVLIFFAKPVSNIFDKSRAF